MMRTVAVQSRPCFTGTTTSPHCKFSNRSSSSSAAAARRIATSRRVTIRAQQDNIIPNQSIDEVPPGCSRYSISIGKPLGIVLEQNKSTGVITVAELVPGGNAEKTGLVSTGDELIACSGYVRTTEQTYGETVVRGGEQLVRLSVRGESFDTVLAAIGSVPGNFQVKLEFQKCQI